MFCTENNFGEFCYTKVVHNDSGIFTIKGYDKLFKKIKIENITTQTKNTFDEKIIRTFVEIYSYSK